MRYRRLALVLVLLAAAVFAPAQRHRTSDRSKSHHTKKDPKQLRNDLRSLRARKSEISKKLGQTRKAVRQVRGDIHSVDNRLSDIETRLDETTTRLSRSRREQKGLAADLASATIQMKAARETARKRIRAMHIQGNGSIFSAYAGSQSVGDFVSRQYVFERIARQDRHVFDEYTRLRAYVADRKQRADRLVVRISGLVSDQRSQQSDLRDTREEKGQLLSQLRSQQGNLEKMAAELDAEESDIEAQIAAYNRGPGRKTALAPFRGRLMRPVSGAMTSGFGMRFHPILKKWRMHKGIDIGARSGTPIHAAADGIVISARYGRGYGNMILIDHGGGISTLYGHCSRLYVSSGQRVHRGQVIGAVGSTGLSTGPHLHFEVHQGRRAVNPLGRL